MMGDFVDFSPPRRGLTFCVMSSRDGARSENLGGQVKCGFCKKLLLYECNSDQLPTFFHSVITFGWVCCCFAVAPTQKWWQNEKKWATGQSCIRKEVTSYKIHTLAIFCLYTLPLAKPAKAKIQMLTTSSWIVTILDFTYLSLANFLAYLCLFNFR